VIIFVARTFKFELASVETGVRARHGKGLPVEVVERCAARYPDVVPHGLILAGGQLGTQEVEREDGYRKVGLGSSHGSPCTRHR
jgi:hypothetical protein